jgi:hypothetical protein
MKVKILTSVVVVGCLFGCAKSLTTTTLKGTVCSCTDTQITVLEEGGQYYDIIPLKGTIINPPVSPPCKAGTPVEVTYNPGDAQRKENPSGTCPPPTATGS